MSEYKRDPVEIFEDSDEIAKALISIAEELEEQDGSYQYWLREAATHIWGMYDDLCDLAKAKQ